MKSKRQWSFQQLHLGGFFERGSSTQYIMECFLIFLHHVYKDPLKCERNLIKREPDVISDVQGQGASQSMINTLPH